MDGALADGVPCALVSASYRSMVDAVLSHCPPDVFDVTVAGDEVSRGKPDLTVDGLRLLVASVRDEVSR
jgi:beta-phosphoglucomutase-like phosphatase (HAD superfamily)